MTDDIFARYEEELSEIADGVDDVTELVTRVVGLAEGLIRFTRSQQTRILSLQDRVEKLEANQW